MPSNYRVELNVEDYLDFMEGGELLFWDKGYGSSTTSRIGDWLLDEGKEEAYSLFNDKDPENGYWMGGKIYRSLEDALGSPREPRVVYHGSGAKFNTFSHKFAMKNGAVKGRGFYFTDDQGYAEGFAPKGGHLFKVFLNLRNPFDAEKLSLSKKDVERVIEHLDPDGDLIVSDYASSANGYPGKAWYRKALKETVDAIVDSSVNDADIISETG